jgi:putative addiction module component (TIGR02574 family)
MLGSYDEAMQAALSLPEDQRVLIVDVLINSVQQPQSQAWCAAWLSEIQQRSREFDENSSSAVPWEEVRANARRRAGLA